MAALWTGESGNFVGSREAVAHASLASACAAVRRTHHCLGTGEDTHVELFEADEDALAEDEQALPGRPVVVDVLRDRAHLERTVRNRLAALQLLDGNGAITPVVALDDADALEAGIRGPHRPEPEHDVLLPHGRNQRDGHVLGVGRDALDRPRRRADQPGAGAGRHAKYFRSVGRASTPCRRPSLSTTGTRYGLVAIARSRPAAAGTSGEIVG